MSMPEFPVPNPEMTQEQALHMILSSIAMEELALSHVINAEGEKIQYALGSHGNTSCPADMADILAVNQSVTSLLEMVMQNQLLLKNKMEKVLEHLPKPPAPPVPPCPPEPPCPPKPKPFPVCFQAVPGFYKCCDAVQWLGGGFCGQSLVDSTNSGTLPLPRTGWLSANVVLELCTAKTAEEVVSVELIMECADKKTTGQLLYRTVSACRAVFSGDMLVQLPCSCAPCCASLLVRSPEGIRIKQGYISFARA